MGGIGRAAGALVRSLVGGAVDPTNIGWNSTIGGSGPTRNTRQWLETHYQSSRLFAAVERVSEDVACTEFNLFRELANGQKKEVRVHPLLDFLERPWIRMGGGSLQALLRLTQAWLEHGGEAFWLLVPGPAGSRAPAEAWPCPPHWITRIPTPGDPWFSICPLGAEIPTRVPPGAIIWFRVPSLLNPYARGAGRSLAVEDEVSQDVWAAKFNAAWFKNGSRPDVIVSVPGLKDTQQERLREQWEARHRGFYNAFKTAFVAAEVKATLLTPNHRDMEFSKLRAFNRDAIFQAWCLPPEIMGLVENSNRATAEAALYLYALNGKLPRLRFLYGELNRLLVPLFVEPGERGKLRLGFQNPVRETEEFRLEKALEAWKAGLIKRDEARKELAWDPVGGDRGEEYLIPVNMQAVTDSSGPAAEPTEEQTALTQALEAARVVVMEALGSGEIVGGRLALPAHGLASPLTNGRSHAE